MIIKQEIVEESSTIKQLSNESPLPSAQMVTVFGSAKRLQDQKLTQFLSARYPNANIIGCSTSGEISPKGVFDNSLQITAIYFEKIQQRFAHTKVSGMKNSYDVAVQLAKEIAGDKLKAILVISDGLNVNGSELLNGFQSVLGEIPIIGGLAGDGGAFVKTVQLYNQDVSDNMVIAVGFYGDECVISSGALGGWKPYGPPRKITKSDKNVVYEMDGKPALSLYRMYIGEAFSRGLPGTGLKFPLAVIEDGKREVEKIRTLLAFNAKDESLTFAGNVDEGETVRLCQSNQERLVEGAAQAAKMLVDNLENKNIQNNGLAICVSCVGRKGVMGDQVSEEIRAVQDVLGPLTTITGFYSYGELAPRPNTTNSVLHNQTMTIGYLSERV